MSGFVSAVPVTVGRSILAPLSLLPGRFQATDVRVGSAESSNDDKAASSSSSSPPQFIQQPLNELLANVPSLNTYVPHPLIPAGHLQTIYSALADTTNVDVVHYKRHILLLPDGGTVAVDVSPPEWDDDSTEEEQKRPTVVLNHGLTGGCHETYVRHVIPPLIASGYRCAVINFRGCGQTPVTSPQMYSAAKTDDLRTGLLFMLNRWKQTEFALIGFSLGANVVAKYMGEEGDDTPVKGGLVLATPFDLKMGSDALAGSKLYDHKMAGNLAQRIGTAAGALSLDPSLRTPLRRLLDPQGYASTHAEEVAERKVKPGSLKWVDDSITRFAGGYSAPHGPFPFASADDYYNANGSIHFLHNVARPLLCLNSDDDPIVPYHILTATWEAAQRNPNVAVAITRGGGHLGWWTAKGWRGATKPSRWLGPVAKQWVEQIFKSDVAKGDDEYKTRNNPWLQGDVETHEGVEYELLAEDEVLEFDVEGGAEQVGKEAEEADAKLKSQLPEAVQQEDGAATTTASKTSAESSPLPGPPRHAWLRTSILPTTRLLHPSQHPNFTTLQQPTQRQLVTDGVMYTCRSRPHVGFLELSEDSRVAGCGQTFQGGKPIPGQSTDTKGDRVEKKGEKGGKGRKKKVSTMGGL